MATFELQFGKTVFNYFSEHLTKLVNLMEILQFRRYGRIIKYFCVADQRIIIRKYF